MELVIKRSFINRLLARACSVFSSKTNQNPSDLLQNKTDVALEIIAKN